MRGTMVVEEESAYQAWLDEQSTFAETMADARSGTRDESSLALNEEAANVSEESVAAMRLEPMESAENNVKGNF